MTFERPTRVDYPEDCRDIRRHAFKLGANWLADAPLWIVEALWSEYSDEVWASGWITGGNNVEAVEQFLEWVRSRGA